MRFFFTSAEWSHAEDGEGNAIAGGYDFQLLINDARVSPITFRANIEIEEDPEGQYRSLVWLKLMDGILVDYQLGGDTVTWDWPVNRWYHIDVAWPYKWELHCSEEEEPSWDVPCADPMLPDTRLEAGIFKYGLVHDPAPTPPGRGEDCCDPCAGDQSCLVTRGPTGDGNLAVAYCVPAVGSQNPHFLRTEFAWNTVTEEWLFSGLPGNLSVQHVGTTREPSPREVYRATVPSTTGAKRHYYANSQTGPFVPEAGLATTLEVVDGGYIETIAGARVYYDSNGKLQRVEDRGAVVTWTYSDNVAWIQADSKPETKLRCDLSAGKVQKVTSYVNWPGWGWVAMAVADPTWSGDSITKITTAPSGSSSQFTYYEDGRLKTLEDCGGRVTSVEYMDQKGA
jgi:hypothetical protein